MHRTSVRDEVEACPGVASEEFSRQQISFESIAGSARQNDVARSVRAAMSERIHVIQRREIEFEA